MVNCRSVKHDKQKDSGSVNSMMTPSQMRKEGEGPWIGFGKSLSSKRGER